LLEFTEILLYRQTGLIGDVSNVSWMNQKCYATCRTDFDHPKSWWRHRNFGRLFSS